MEEKINEDPTKFYTKNNKNEFQIVIGNYSLIAIFRLGFPENFLNTKYVRSGNNRSEYSHGHCKCAREVVYFF